MAQLHFGVALCRSAVEDGPAFTILGVRHEVLPSTTSSCENQAAAMPLDVLATDSRGQRLGVLLLLLGGAHRRAPLDKLIDDRLQERRLLLIRLQPRG